MELLQQGSPSRPIFGYIKIRNASARGNELALSQEGPAPSHVHAKGWSRLTIHVAIAALLLQKRVFDDIYSCFLATERLKRSPYLIRGMARCATFY